MIELAAALFILTGALLTLLLCSLWALLVVAFAAASSAPIPIASIEKARTVFNCGGDELCVRKMASIIDLHNFNEVLIGPTGVLQLFACLAIISILISVGFTQSRLRSYQMLDKKSGICLKLQHLVPELSKVRIILIKPKHGFLTYPFTINRTIYFNPPLLANQSVSQFCLLHELFHCNMLFPTERIFFAAIFPLTVAVTAIMFPLAAFMIGDLGIAGIPLAILFLIVPRYLLKKLKKSMYVAVESAADLNATRIMGQIPTELSHRKRQFRISQITVEALEMENRNAIRSLSNLAALIIAPISICILHISSKLPRGFQIHDSLVTALLLAQILLVIGLFRIPRKLSSNRIYRARLKVRHLLYPSLAILLTVLILLTLNMLTIQSLGQNMDLLMQLALSISIMSNEFTPSVIVCALLGIGAITYSFLNTRL